MSAESNTNPISAVWMRNSRLPLWSKLAFTAFMAVLVPYYWTSYGPTNFLYFCDIALFLTLGAFWLEKPLLASMPAVGILVPQALWMADFLTSLVGFPLAGLTSYMFDPNLSLTTRGLSFFHFWLPIVLVILVWRLGYDRRAFTAWTVLAWALMLICYFFMPAPPALPATEDGVRPPVNINYVYGLSNDVAQTWMPAPAWLATLMIGIVPICYVPAHLILAKLFGRHPDSDSTAMTASS